MEPISAIHVNIHLLIMYDMADPATVFSCRLSNSSTHQTILKLVQKVKHESTKSRRQDKIYAAVISAMPLFSSPNHRKLATS